MRKELGNIAVYSAKKVQIENELTGECGFKTNENNVYEIADSDLNKSLELGFSIQPGVAALPPPVQSSLTPLIFAVGYYWSSVTAESDSGKQYYFYATSGKGEIVSGFWCDCPRATPTWSGTGDNNDCTTNANDNDKGRKIPGLNLPAPPTATGPGLIVCCKGRPKVVKRNSLTSPATIKILIDRERCI